MIVIKNTLLMLLTVGFPVVPIVGVPLFIPAVVFKFKTFHRELVKYKISNFLLLILSIFYILISLSVSSDYPGLVFSIKLLIKIWLSYLSGIFVALLILEDFRIVGFWLVVQIFLIFLSSYFESIYFLLLNFMSVASRDTFEHIFGLRGLGFGVYHVDGALAMSFFALFPLIITQKKIRMNSVNYLSILASILLARSSILMSVVVLCFKKPIVLLLSITLFLIISIYITDEFGPIYHAFEIFRNLVQDGSLYTTSTNANLEMIIWPHDISSFFYGYGLYFDEAGLFFMNTDLGWFRVLLFGGVFYLAIFFLLNIFQLFTGQINLFHRSLLLILFFAMNLKGIMILPFYVMVLSILNRNQAKNL